MISPVFLAYFFSIIFSELSLISCDLFLCSDLELALENDSFCADSVDALDFRSQFPAFSIEVTDPTKALSGGLLEGQRKKITLKEITKYLD